MTNDKFTQGLASQYNGQYSVGKKNNDNNKNKQTVYKRVFSQKPQSSRRIFSKVNFPPKRFKRRCLCNFYSFSMESKGDDSNAYGLIA